MSVSDDETLDGNHSIKKRQRCRFLLLEQVDLYRYARFAAG
jgi:hypothetical protein